MAERDIRKRKVNKWIIILTLIIMEGPMEMETVAEGNRDPEDRGRIIRSVRV